jgi:large subunit ribosomal protein L18
LQKSVGVEYGGNIDAAIKVGKKTAELAISKGITSVYVDRGGHPYHGRIRSLCEAARESGLSF